MWPFNKRTTSVQNHTNNGDISPTLTNAQPEENNSTSSTPWGDKLREANGINPDDKPKEQIVERHPVMNTPFTIINKLGKEDTYCITSGKYRLTEEDMTYKECKDCIEHKSWILISGLMIALIETEKEQSKN